MKVAIIGAGGVGAYYGALLALFEAETGVDTSVHDTAAAALR